MPKLKTHSGAKKRARITKTGKLVRRRAGVNHFLQKKSGSRKRQFAGTETLGGARGKALKRQMGAR